MSDIKNIVKSELKGFSKSDIDTLVGAGIVPKGTPPDQVQVFARVCSEKGLSPFSKEIHLVGYGNIYNVITGINGFRKIACESGSYAGCDDVKFDLSSDGKYKTAAQLKMEGKLPKTATTIVYRIVQGVRCDFTHTAVFAEFSSGKQKWKTMPFQMISKVSEAFALRKGFSDRLTGLFIPEEKAAIVDGQVITDSETVSIQNDDFMSVAKKEIDKCETLEDLQSLYNQNPDYQNNNEVLALLTQRKEKINGKTSS